MQQKSVKVSTLALVLSGDILNVCFSEYVLKFIVFFFNVAFKTVQIPKAESREPTLPF